MILTNKRIFVDKPSIFETDTSDLHKFIVVLLTSIIEELIKNISVLKIKKKKFGKYSFSEELCRKDRSLYSSGLDKNYSISTALFSELVGKHAVLEKKFIRSNHVLLMTEDSRKAIF